MEMQINCRNLYDRTPSSGGPRHIVLYVLKSAAPRTWYWYRSVAPYAYVPELHQKPQSRSLLSPCWHIQKRKPFHFET